MELLALSFSFFSMSLQITLETHPKIPKCNKSNQHIKSCIQSIPKTHSIIHIFITFLLAEVPSKRVDGSTILTIHSFLQGSLMRDVIAK